MTVTIDTQAHLAKTCQVAKGHTGQKPSRYSLGDGADLNPTMNWRGQVRSQSTDLLADPLRVAETPGRFQSRI